MSITFIIGLLVHISFLLCIVMITVVVRKCQPSQIRTAFLCILGIMTVWNAGDLVVIDLLMATGAVTMLFVNIGYIGVCLVPVAVLYLAKAILHSDWEPRPIHALFLVLPLISITVIFTNPLHHLFFINFSLLSSEVVCGWYFYIHSVYSYGCISAAIFLMLLASARNSGVFSRQSMLVLLGIVVTIVPNLLYTFGKVALPCGISSAAFTVTMLCFGVAFLKYRFISSLPITLRQVVDLISDGYLVIDKESCILSYNQTLLNLFPEKVNISYGDNLRTLIDRLFLDASYDQLLELQAQAVAQKKTVSVEKYFVGDKYVRVEITAVMQKNAHIGSIILLKDITQSKLLIDATNAASRAKSDFLAKMSHEIRTPMNAIIGMAELALRENEKELKNEHLATIKQAGSNLLSIINDILDFSKIETGKLEIFQENFSFSSLINDVISIIKMRIIDSEVRFVVNVDKNIPNSLNGDEARIRQALLNILNNAVKYTERGFVSLNIRGEFVGEDTVNLVMEVADSGRGIKQEDIEKLFEDFTQFDVKNNKDIEGVGLGLSITHSIVTAMGGSISVKSEYKKGSTFTLTLPQKYNNREAFANVENPEEKSVLLCERREIYSKSIINTLNNLGVNCTLVSNYPELYERMTRQKFTFLFIAFQLFKSNKETIVRYGDNIKVVVLAEFGEAVPDKNLMVLSMPVYSISIANILNGVTESFSYNNSSELIARFTAPDAKILVVDDINTNLKVAQGLLLPYKVHTDLCKSGAEAIRSVKSGRYDLVFMDHKMPEMDGVEATHHIRGLAGEDPYYKNLPIVALTANAVSGTREFFLENGFDDFLSKPIDTVKLNLILEKWIPVSKQKVSVPNRDEFIQAESFEIPGLDTEKGISMSNGSKEGFLSALSSFYEDGLEIITKIKESLETGNLSLYTIYVHGLKTAASLIGSDDLSGIAKELENAGKEGNMVFIEAYNPGFIAKLELLLYNIRGVIN